MPVRAMDEMRLMLSKKQREDGTWYRPIFAAMPPNATRASNRAVGTHKPLRVPSPKVPPGLLLSGLYEQLAGSLQHVCWRREPQHRRMGCK
eukprot:5638947-Pleurochrysis_carterae.AAC.1